MHRGYTKNWRKIVDWGWYKDSYCFHIFSHLITIANHKDTVYMGHEIKKGQAVIGRKTLSFSTGISEQSVRTALNKLKSTSEITIKSTNKFSIVTICNYSLYQNEKERTNHQNNQLSNIPLTSNQPATNQQLTTSKELIRTNNNDKNTYTTFEAPTVADVKQLFVEKKSTETEADRFFNYYESNGWKVGKNKMKNWKAAAAGWILRSQPTAADKKVCYE